MSYGAHTTDLLRRVLRPLGNECVGLGDQHLGQYSAGAFTCNLGQGIVDRLRLTERNDGDHLSLARQG
jgi:hypothetical protein